MVERSEERELTVLIVEDDPLTAEAHADFVRRVPGFAVAGIALGGVEALARYDESIEWPSENLAAPELRHVVAGRATAKDV